MRRFILAWVQSAIVVAGIVAWFYIVANIGGGA